MLDVSVVVATRNRPQALRGCLESLAASTLRPGRLEVIVVDDGSSMPLSPIVSGASEQLDVRSIRIEHRGPAAARNAGVREARAPIVAFTDDDCVVRPDWAERLAVAVAAAPDVIAGGLTVNGLAANPYAAMSQRIVDAVYAWKNADPADGGFVTSNNMALDRAAFDRMGGFDERFRDAAEDRELCDRWRSRGGRIVIVPEAVVEHRNELDVARFAAQHLRYGRGAYRYHRARQARGVPSIREESGFVLDPRSWPWSDPHGSPAASRARDAGLVLLWQGANAAGFAVEAARSLVRPSRVARRSGDG